MRRYTTHLWLTSIAVLLVIVAAAPAAEQKGTSEEGFVPLFPKEGVVKDWLVRSWSDVNKPADPRTVWVVKDGILQGGEPRGSWLLSRASIATLF